LSIPLALVWGPLLGTPHAREVDAIKKHRQLRRVELGAQCAFLHLGKSEAALLEPLVEEDEAAVVPREDLHPVAPARDEEEEMPREQILVPHVADHGRESVDALP